MSGNVRAPDWSEMFRVVSIADVSCSDTSPYSAVDTRAGIYLFIYFLLASANVSPDGGFSGGSVHFRSERRQFQFLYKQHRDRPGFLELNPCTYVGSIVRADWLYVV